MTVALILLGILAGVLVPRVALQGAASRDARRLADMKTLAGAIEAFYADHGRWPEPRKNQGFGGWDVSHDGDFIPELLEKGYLDHVVADPLNDNEHQYRYYVYPAASYGCEGRTPFYVLGLTAFETSRQKKETPGFLRCRRRDWGREFDYVTGGGAAFR